MTSTEQIANKVYARFTGSGLSIDQLEAEIESLGFQAARIELWNSEPGTPPWMRRMDAERVQKLRDTQAQLLSELAEKKLRAHDSIMENLPRVNVGIAKPGIFRAGRDAFRGIAGVVLFGAAAWYGLYRLILWGVK